MKKLLLIIVFVLITTAQIGCGVKDKTSENSAIDILESIQKVGDYSNPIIDSICLDIDNDGIDEDCSIFAGPTYGVRTYLIIASIDDNVKYKDIFTISSSDFAFNRASSIPSVIINGESHKLFIEDEHIRIEW